MCFPARCSAFYSKLFSRGGSIHARDSRGSALFALIITDSFRGTVVISIMWWTKRLTCFSSEPISWFSLAEHGWTRYSPAGSIVQDNGKSVFAVGVWSGATMTSGRLLSFQRTEGWIRGNFNGMAYCNLAVSSSWCMDRRALRISKSRRSCAALQLGKGRVVHVGTQKGLKGNWSVRLPTGN